MCSLSEVVSFMEKHKVGKSDGDYWAVRWEIKILNRQLTDSINEKVSKCLKWVREQDMKLYKWKYLPGR